MSFRATTRLARPVLRKAQQVPRRMMSGGHGGDIVAETKQAESWTKLTVPIVGAFLCFVSYAEISHLKHSDEHPFVKPLYPYLRRNDKPFCWENKECSFFQVECHRAKRAGGKADH